MSDSIAHKDLLGGVLIVPDRRDSEIATLRAEGSNLKGVARHHKERAEALRAENERLRAALEEIVKPGGADGFWECVEIARSARGDKQ